MAHQFNGHTHRSRRLTHHTARKREHRRHHHLSSLHPLLFPATTNVCACVCVAVVLCLASGDASARWDQSVATASVRASHKFACRSPAFVFTCSLARRPPPAPALWPGASANREANRVGTTSGVTSTPTSAVTRVSPGQGAHGQSATARVLTRSLVTRAVLMRDM